MQITVFENDGRFPVQFELNGQTQIYRFRKGDGLTNLGQLREYVDDEFRVSVLRQFEEMQRIQARVLAHMRPAADDTDELPVII